MLLQVKGYEIILGMDDNINFNSSISEMSLINIICGLVDPIGTYDPESTHLHTFIRGRKQIYILLCSPTINVWIDNVQLIGNDSITYSYHHVILIFFLQINIFNLVS